jgi:hypothetical protein
VCDRCALREVPSINLRHEVGTEALDVRGDKGGIVPHGFFNFTASDPDDRLATVSAHPDKPPDVASRVITALAQEFMLGVAWILDLDAVSLALAADVTPIPRFLPEPRHDDPFSREREHFTA